MLAKAGSPLRVMRWDRVTFFDVAHGIAAVSWIGKYSNSVALYSNLNPCRRTGYRVGSLPLVHRFYVVVLR